MRLDQPTHVEPIPLAHAIATVRGQLTSPLEQEVVRLSSARGRVLAADLVAPADLPPRDSCAVDGFAIRAADLVPQESVGLKLIGEALAGHPFDGVVHTGQAVRVLTGAQAPRGADLVVMQETCILDGDTVAVRGDHRAKTNWRRRGEDVRVGALVWPAGRRLQAKDMALAGALGCREVPVRKQLRVGLFSTGDKLREPGLDRGDGQIWDANRCLLRPLLEHMGCQVQDLGILQDDPCVVERALSAGARDCVRL